MQRIIVWTVFVFASGWVIVFLGPASEALRIFFGISSDRLRKNPKKLRRMSEAGLNTTRSKYKRNKLLYRRNPKKYCKVNSGLLLCQFDSICSNQSQFVAIAINLMQLRSICSIQMPVCTFCLLVILLLNCASYCSKY